MMKDIFMGLFFITLDMNVPIGSGTLGLLPDFVGYWLLWKAMSGKGKAMGKGAFIAKKLMEENIDGDFVKKWNEKILMSLDEQHRDEFTKSVISICKKEMSQTQFERMMHSVIQSNILPIEFFKENSVSALEIEDMYYNEEISEDEIINYYNSNLLGNESIQMLFGLDYDLIIERIKEGKLNIKALSAILTFRVM